VRETKSSETSPCIRGRYETEAEEDGEKVPKRIECEKKRNNVKGKKPKVVSRAISAIKGETTRRYRPLGSSDLEKKP